MNIVGAIRLGHIAEAVTEQYKTVNGESVIYFMEKLRAQHSDMGLINIIVDGAGYNKSAVVIESMIIFRLLNRHFQVNWV